MTTYRGKCHCGRVQFEIDSDFERVVRCNCSMCRRRGATMLYVPEAQLRVLEGKDSLTLYQFHTRKAEHYFCRVCGIYTFHRTRRFADKFAVNVGCLEGVDVYGLAPELIDGAAFD